MLVLNELGRKKQGLLAQAPFPGDGHRQCDGRFSRPVVLLSQKP